MKSIILVAIGTLLIFNVQAQNKNIKLSKLELAKANIKKHLLNTLNDPSSYQPAGWGKLITLFRTFNADGEYNYLIETPIYSNERINIIDREIALQSQSIVDNKPLNNEINTLALKRDILLKMKENATQKLDSLINNYKSSKIIGYSISHSLRAKNAYGGLVLNSYTFFLDEKLRVVSSESD